MLRGVEATPPAGALRAAFEPSPSAREESASGAPQPQETTTALLIIDAQNYNCTRAGALWNGGSGSSRRSSAEELCYFFSRLQGEEEGESSTPGVIRNWVSLADAARSAGVRVVFTVMSDATGEASHASRVTSRDYRISGFRIPPGSWDAQLIEELKGKGGQGGGEENPNARSGASASPSASPSDLFLPKTSCNVFLSTALDFHLRSMRARQLLVAGVVTDQCVAAAAATAADLGYHVTLVEDACAATSEGRHEAALRTLRGFARVRSTEEVVSELLASC